jgi:hypothetical protein
MLSWWCLLTAKNIILWQILKTAKKIITALAISAKESVHFLSRFVEASRKVDMAY